MGLEEDFIHGLMLFLQVCHRSTGEVMVLKLNKKRSGAARQGGMLKEVQLMNTLRHTNILE